MKDFRFLFLFSLTFWLHSFHVSAITYEWEDSTRVSDLLLQARQHLKNQNTVLLQRTPILFYNYDMFEAETGTWIENAVQVPMPLGPVWPVVTMFA